MRIILASSSPRRQEILKNMNMEFDIIPSNIKEEAIICNNIEENAIKIAQQKAKDIFEKTKEDRMVIGADTIVIFNNKILGKPNNVEQAKCMLNSLAGKQCVVYTGMYVIAEINNIKKEYIKLSNCKIKLKELTPEEIESYILTKEPMDKAGGFAIQGIGAKYVEDIQGDFYAGIGLSIYELYNVFKQIKEDFNIDLKM